MRVIPPITPTEFFQHLQRCIPPVGWSNKIAVANSGGPDSTALLFLLSTVVQNRQRGRVSRDHHGLPRQVVSIHVNHDLQPAAKSMEGTATQTARRLGVPSFVQKIPWGLPPFPERPGGDVAGEKIAREVRYNRLFAAMQQTRAHVIAFAHHADDQVETAIMRMSQGSSARGLAGMRPVRRWGMGQQENEYFAFGEDGMRHWIVRPLLHVSKDRLLATCEANRLDYVNDPTNFQPGITIRNAIRRAVATSRDTQLSGSIDDAHFDISPYSDKLRAMVPNAPYSQQLREAVRLFGIRLDEVETQVTEILNQARLPFTASTLLLQKPIIAKVTDDQVRTSLIRRCLRFISHGPWGSPWAEVHGDRDAYNRIARELWPETADHERRTFTAGAGVLVTPVAILDKTRRYVIRNRLARGEGEIEGWVWSRAPPYERALSASPLDLNTRLDITDALVQAIKDSRSTSSFLYDYRFALKFHLHRIPTEIYEEILDLGAKVVVQCDTKWILPVVMLIGRKPRRIAHFTDRSFHNTVDVPSWIQMSFVRSIHPI
ncbi:adenine nucleotide alpha hydrolases-like protein [Daedaleopsis nitida]|nr:adenine nucleotide alpha hydrolases-like protein [Daedaleopsis nitida]